MPRKKKGFWDNVQKNWTGFILGAIIIIIIGLLIANFLRGRGSMIGTGEQTTTSQQESPSPSSYKVVEGDSLSKIAEHYYQDQTYWPVLAQANKIVNPNVIYADSTLNIPSKDEASKMREAMTQTSYTVKSDDTLFAIAEKMYGDGSKWSIIARANNLGRLPNGNPLVFADSTIKIPR